MSTPTEEEPIPNKVEKRMEKTGTTTLNLDTFHTPGERVLFDMKDQLWQGIALKEKDFKQFIRDHDWSQYQGKFVALTCSEDAIIPYWAYMQVAANLSVHAAQLVFGDKGVLEAELFRKAIHDAIDPEEYAGKRVIIKGCGEVEVPASAFVEITGMLAPYAKQISYGEPCSMVKVFTNRGRQEGG